ncbi:glutamate--trna ligase [Holotrichia oblita]|nr:glutamate--trna ligase [Holotrichia oblita]
MTLCDISLARSLGGKALLRIEDTDQKREVQGATQAYVDIMKRCGMEFDEGFDGQKDYGKYGPYVQSHRKDIYHVFGKRLVELGRAYPCFCTEDDLDNIRKQQETKKQKTGYYGEYAVCKNLTFDQIKQKIESGKSWVLRADFGTAGDTRITWKDLVKGDMSAPTETNDPVIIKSNGIPPYNLAHIVDDTLMHISHVIRGEEWLVSTAQHIQLFNLFDLTHPNYLHMPVICIEEDGNKRKLSKRKDREAVVENFLNDGYPVEALIEYLLTLYNTDFEIWRIQNPNSPYQEFKFTTEKIGSNSPLFDWKKLNDISKNIIAKKTCVQINEEVKNFFAKRTDEESKAINKNLDKVFAALAIDRETEKPRKDIVKYSDIYSLYSYLFDGNFNVGELNRDIIKAYADIYNPKDTKDEWFARIKQMCPGLGYCDNIKEYKQNPSAYKGHVGDVTQAIRLAVCGRENTPDLYAILKILGKETVLKRLKIA